MVAQVSIDYAISYYKLSWVR